MFGKYSIRDLLRFSDRGASSLATSLLDYIVSQAEVDKQNALYKLVNYRRSGTLVDAYLKGGNKELERMAAEEMKTYMYQNGKGEVLDEKTLKTYRDSCNNQVVIAMDDCSACKPEETQKARFVCWKLEYRGMLGESLLHVLVLCNTDVHTRIAKFLVDLYPELAKDIVEGDEYYGASALHFSIAYENGVLVKKLVEVGAPVNQRANGTFFHPTDQQWPIPRKKTNFEGLSYLGEFPLAWAACCEDESSYNLLLKHGADPNMQDSYGNSILHVVVVRDKLKMYGYALRHPLRPATDRLYNKYGLTPLTLACKLGRNKIFREMLEFSSLEFWRYSNITCSGYPLNALDSLQPNGKANLNSALMIILNGSTTEHLDMLDGGVIQRLLEEKWKTFAQARYCAEIGVCIGCVGFSIFQQVQEILAQGFFGFLVSLASSPSKSAFMISCLLILSCIPCRVVGDRNTEDLLLVLAIPGSWFFLIFFAGAVRLTGPFVTMIYSMLVGDMFRFSIIYLIFLFGFTQAFYFLFKNPPSEKGDTKKRFTTFPVTWMGLFHMTLGSYEYEDFRETFYQKLTQMVFAMFMVFTPILLLNMLIAMMGNTYCEVITQSEKEWVKQWAKIVVVLERAIDNKSAKEFIQTYSIKMPSGDKDDPDNEVRGVIVIKSKQKSKAKEKKQALSLWKRVGKRTVQELRKVGGSAAEVRRKYHLFQPKQPIIRLQVGAVTQEGLPMVFDGFSSRGGQNQWQKLNQLTSTTAIKLNKVVEGRKIGNTSTISSNGFGELFSQVTSASGIDIGKGVVTDTCNVTHVQNEIVPDQELPLLNFDKCPEISMLSNRLIEGAYDNPTFMKGENSHKENLKDKNDPISTIANPTIFNETEKNQHNQWYHCDPPNKEDDIKQVQSFESICNPDIDNEETDKATDTMCERLPKLEQCEKKRLRKRKKRKMIFKKSRVEDIDIPNNEDSSDEHSICVNVKTEVISRSRRQKHQLNKSSSLCKIDECAESTASENEGKYKGMNEYQSTNSHSKMLSKHKKTRRKREICTISRKVISQNRNYANDGSMDSSILTSIPMQKTHSATSVSSLMAWEDPPQESET